jgi:hypothetical protein
MVSPGMKRDTSGRIALLERTIRSMRRFCDAHSSEDLSGCIVTHQIRDCASSLQLRCSGA